MWSASYQKFPIWFVVPKILGNTGLIYDYHSVSSDTNVVRFSYNNYVFDRNILGLKESERDRCTWNKSLEN